MNLQSWQYSYFRFTQACKICINLNLRDLNALKWIKWNVKRMVTLTTEKRICYIFYRYNSLFDKVKVFQCPQWQVSNLWDWCKVCICNIFYSCVYYQRHKLHDVNSFIDLHRSLFEYVNKIWNFLLKLNFKSNFKDVDCWV